MRRIIIVAGTIISVLLFCDILSCLNFHRNEWKWDTGPRISDYISFDSDLYSYKTHSIIHEKQTQGYLIFSFGNHALLFISEGKDDANHQGLSVYIKL